MKKIMMIAALAMTASLANADDQMAPATEAYNSADGRQEEASAAAVEVIEIVEVESADAPADTEATDSQ